MKNILLSAALLLAVNAQAQITLSSTSYPASVKGTDSLKVTTAASAFPSLTFMANGSWDLSAVTDSTPVLYAYRVNPDTASAQFADSNFYAFSTYTYQGNVQSLITSSGLLEYGIDVDSASFALGSGNLIYIPITHSVFTAPHTVIKYPATMGTTWSSTYESDFNFMITYSPLYSNSAGVVKSFVTETDSVKGWGVMRIKTLAGTPSSWFQVLQVAKKTVVLDSFLIGGVSPNPLVLSGLGVTQGQVTTTYEQDYYRAEEVSPFADVQFTDSTYSTPSKATTHTQRTVNLGIAETAANGGVSIYPNPVNGGEVTITLPAMGGTWSYELIDMSGKTVAAEQLAASGNVAHLSIPASVAPGICYIRLSNNGKEVAVKAIDIVK
jgi:hypothetical protein